MVWRRLSKGGVNPVFYPEYDSAALNDHDSFLYFIIILIINFYFILLSPYLSSF